jgi:hypothetical protein
VLIFCLDGFTNQTFGNGYEAITTDSKLKDGNALLQLGHFRISRDAYFQSGSLDTSAAFSRRYWLELYSIGMVAIGLVARSQYRCH